MAAIKDYQKDFLEFAIASHALRFGSFTLKSGRFSPYFFNIGNFHSGKELKTLSTYYAHAIKENFGQFDVLFGPSYKGIPLSVSTVMALSDLGEDVSYATNRKESKDHGEKGVIMGHPITKEERIVLIDDVVTSGISVEESLSLLHDVGAEKILGLIVSLDRKEKSLHSSCSALKEIERNNNIKACAIVDIDTAIDYLSQSHLDLFKDGLYEKVLAYREEYKSLD